MESKALLKSFQIEGDVGSSIDFSKDAQQAVCGTLRGQLILFDTKKLSIANAHFEKPCIEKVCFLEKDKIAFLLPNQFTILSKKRWLTVSLHEYPLSMFERAGYSTFGKDWDCQTTIELVKEHYQQMIFLYEREGILNEHYGFKNAGNLHGKTLIRDLRDSRTLQIQITSSSMFMPPFSTLPIFTSESSIVHFCLSQDKKHVVCALENGTMQFLSLVVKKYDVVVKKDELITSPPYNSVVDRVAMSCDNNWVVGFNMHSSNLLMWHIQRNKIYRVCASKTFALNKIIISPDSKNIATLFSNGSVAVWPFQNAHQKMLQKYVLPLAKSRHLSSSTIEIVFNKIFKLRNLSNIGFDVSCFINVCKNLKFERFYTPKQKQQ